MTMNVIVLLGAPGSGKGTTAEKIRDRLGAVHLSTGDMLRSAVREGTPTGRKAKACMEKGELVPDDVMVCLVEDRMNQGAENPLYLLDGFPRTAEQARLLEQCMTARGGRIARVVFLDAPREVLIDRLAGRRICRQCGMNFHVRNIPPKKDGICDACGGELYQRPDDNRETIENRLDVYVKQTRDLIEMYSKRGLLSRVDSAQGADALADEVAKIVRTE